MRFGYIVRKEGDNALRGIQQRNIVNTAVSAQKAPIHMGRKLAEQHRSAISLSGSAQRTFQARSAGASFVNNIQESFKSNTLTIGAPKEGGKDRQKKKKKKKKGGPPIRYFSLNNLVLIIQEKLWPRYFKLTGFLRKLDGP